MTVPKTTVLKYSLQIFGLKGCDRLSQNLLMAKSIATILLGSMLFGLWVFVAIAQLLSTLVLKSQV
jgi:hypothetical protein